MTNIWLPRLTTAALLAFSLAAHLVFASTRALLGAIWLPAAYLDLVPTSRATV